MFVRIEVFGHYLELGKTAEAEEAEPIPEGTQYPLQVCAEPLGFRILSEDGEIATDV